ncbi:T9SS type A sorting domain-containing protein [Mangrovimonas cancribranchiae]|uniref:T9SS type A sorting domain-containing protein n=1 Tax=Mangrovimonas cancribranchiae TaxID=3080055 RepID=A0AAU6P3D1_9FLAO
MRKITFCFLVLCCVAFSWQSMAQCDFDGNQYPADPVILTNDGSAEEISGCNYFGEYSVVQNLNIGDEYVFDADGGYVTIIDGADGATVLANGASPLTWTATATDVEAHWAADAACGTDFSCHVTSVTNNDGAPGAEPDCATTPTPAVGATDVTVGNTTLSWMAPTTGPTPTAYYIYEYDDEFGTNPGLIGTVTTTSMDVTINVYETTIYWAAIPVNVSTEATGCDVWSFTTEATPPPPANDDFANAQAVTCGGNYTGSTDLATLDEDDAPDGFGADMDAPNVWFSYDSSVEGAADVTINLCPSDYDTSFLVYTGTSGNLTLVGGNDDNNVECTSGTRSYGSFTADGTQTYYIAVEGWNSTSTGIFDMTITCEASCTPAQANQDCASAIAMAVDGNANTVDNTCASVNPEQTSCDSFSSIADIWYTFEAPASGEVDIATTLGTATAAHVAVYNGACGTLGEEDCSSADEVSLSLTGLTAGETYYLQLWNNGSEEGTFDVTLSDPTMSIEDFGLSTLFTYYPNPVNNMLSLKAQSNISNVSVYNMLGQEVIRTAPNTVTNDVNMSELQAGAYFVKVTVNGTTETIRIIKK